MDISLVQPFGTAMRGHRPRLQFSDDAV